MSDIDKRIEEIVREKGPITLVNICKELDLDIAINSIRISLNRLVKEGQISKLEAKNSGNIYYYAPRGVTFSDVSNMHKEIAKETVEVKDTYEELEKKYEKINKSVNGIYANIISIISIVVGIFALITVNANIVFKLTEGNMENVFIFIIAINIFVVICIIALLLMVRFVIIEPLLNGTKKDKKSQKA